MKSVRLIIGIWTLTLVCGCATQQQVEITMDFHDFEMDRVGKVPSGFKTALTTGGGEPAQWLIREETDAPSGHNVVAQTSKIRKNSRFPMLILDKLIARDVDVSVRFKSISGRIDQAAGIVWRYQNKDNYFIVRANALEDNVVAYKAETKIVDIDGKIKTLKKMRKALVKLTAACDKRSPMGECPIIDFLDWEEGK